ncbi:DUF3696 domain-containing protein [Salinisphaera aquimarina]|uniref:DUF3696 domain-containing protein n=1 Tax=Salinisphaera aquimarina TaxID=2094031 RepID=A0ABV7ERQ0_9GAMM
MLKSVRIRGLRSLADTGAIPLTNLNLLVGRNSSGKSTFARVFALLRQSMEANTKGPILWYGPLVDFGSFDEAVTRDLPDREIEFIFNISYPLTARRATNFGRRWISSFDDLGSESVGDTNAKLSILLGATANSKETYLKTFTLDIYDVKTTIELNPTGEVTSIKVGDYEVAADDSFRILSQSGTFLPRIRYYQRRVSKVEGKELTRWLETRNSYARRDLDRQISQHVHGNTTRNSRLRIARNLPLTDIGTFTQRLVSVPAAPQSWRSSLKNATPRSSRAIKLQHRVFATRIDGIINELDSFLSSYFKSVRYIEPLRAVAERYYRKQELAVDEIDSKGSNVAMYLNSLTKGETRSFISWMKSIFGGYVSAVSRSGHITLQYTDSQSEQSFNIADVGFGLSQVLPLAVQIWSSAYRPNVTPGVRRLLRKNDTSVLVIEQPELHLHPDFQARVANMISSAIQVAKERDNPLSIVIETHSPWLINRIGELISSQKLNEKDVCLHLFEGNSQNSLSSVRKVMFDNNGILKDWPFGFFDPI